MRALTETSLEQSITLNKTTNSSVLQSKINWKLSAQLKLLTLSHWVSLNQEQCDQKSQSEERKLNVTRRKWELKEKKKPLEERVSASYRLAIAYCLIFYWLHLIGLEVWVTFLDQPVKQTNVIWVVLDVPLKITLWGSWLTYLRNYGLNKLCRVFHLFNYMSKAAQTGLKRRRETELKCPLRQI